MCHENAFIQRWVAQVDWQLSCMLNEFFALFFMPMKTLTFPILKTARLLVLFAGCLLSSTILQAQPGGQSAGGGNSDDTPRQVLQENECLRLLEKTRSPETHHFQQPHRPLVVIGQEGTEMLIPADAFLYPDGSPVTKDVEVLLTEIANKPDLILNNLPTISNGRMLVSGGVIKIEAVADGKQLHLAPGKSVLVNFPGGYVQDMQLFKGQYNAAGQMNWVPMSDAPKAGSHPMAKLDPGKDLAMPLFLDYGKVNPINFQFADVEHNLNGYIIAMLRTGYKCVGSDRVYLEMNTDDNGRVISAKTLTGRNPCYRLAIEEIAQTVQFDMALDDAKRKQYFLEVSPSEEAKGTEGENMFASLAGNADAFNNPQVLAAMKEYMEEEKAQNFAKNAFAVTELGWVNCDRFYNEPGQRVSVVASITNEALQKKAKAFLVFDGFNAVIEGQMGNNGQFTFNDIPAGLKAKVVMIGYSIGDGAYMKTVPVITKAGNVADVNMSKISEYDLRQAMAAL